MSQISHFHEGCAIVTQHLPPGNQPMSWKVKLYVWKLLSRPKIICFKYCILRFNLLGGGRGVRSPDAQTLS